MSNKKLFSTLLIVFVGLFALSPLLADDNSSSTTTNKGKEIELAEKKSRPTKSLFIAPDIRAYNHNGWVAVEFNEAIAGDVTIVITDEEGNIIGIDTVRPVSPMRWESFINCDEETTCYIEIAGGDWILSGEF